MTILCSTFLENHIGDCRMNALTLAVAMNMLEKRGIVKDVEYGNRKWGFSKTLVPPTPTHTGHFLTYFHFPPTVLTALPKQLVSKASMPLSLSVMKAIPVSPPRNHSHST